MDSQVKHLKSLEGAHLDTVTCLKVAGNNQLISSGGKLDGTIKIWDIDSKKCVATLIHGDRVDALELISDDELASGGGGKLIKIWSMRNGECLRTLDGHKWPVVCLKVLDNGELVSGSEDTTIRIWNLASAQCWSVLKGHTDAIVCLEICENNTQLVSGSEDGTMRFWNLEMGGKFLRTIKVHPAAVTRLKSLPNGQMLSASDDCTLKISDIITGQCLQSFHGHTNWIRCLEILANGREVMSGSWDESVKIWQISNGECLKSLKIHNAPVTCLSKIGKNDEFVSGSSDGTIKIWEI
jgi:WD40 repeat protein